MKKIYIKILGIIILWLILVSIFQMNKPLPSGVNYTGEVRGISADNVTFLYDLTYETDGARVREQHIFDRVFSCIQGANKYILIDMFLFNSYLGKANSSYRSLSQELVEQIINAKEKKPGIRIDVITDPINTLYGGAASPEIEKLKKHGINVIITDLKPLRDSNAFYSSFWRTFVQWWGNSSGGWFPHPFSSAGQGVSLRSYFNMINFKANHRKLFVADSGDSYVSIIMSANPHDASSSHSNVALEIRGPVSADLYNTESGVASLSHEQLSKIDMVKSPDPGKEVAVQVVSEGAILKTIINEITSTRSGDNINIAMFYLSERNIIKALIDAADRGVNIRMVLDTNKDAFGYEKSGIPNRPVARELINETKGKIQVRWYKTNGEQFHSKMMFIERGQASTIILGSANFTRRNLKNYNLELDVILKGKGTNPVFSNVKSYFNRIWDNQDGSYTTDYAVYQDDSFLKGILYNIQERLGISSF
jgi:phosphatidylserine/phosphatidylglycerophosphate/cardiolipin synthase-like enzyme